MARRYKSNHRVIGADLRNELRDTQFDEVTWGKGVKATDWNQAAEEAAERVAAANPDMLIIVEGIGFAGNLENVPGHPIKVPKKVDFLSNLCLELLKLTYFVLGKTGVFWSYLPLLGSRGQQL